MREGTASLPMRWFALAVLVSLLLGGCSEDAPEGEATDQPSVITDPRDTSYLANATPGSHIHDYWQGRDRVPVLDDETGGGTIQYTGDHGRMASFQPPDGQIVPQGAAVIEGTLSWVEEEGPALLPNEYTHVELWVKTARDAKSHFAARPDNGGSFAFNTTNEEDDPPHYVLSLWEFDLIVWNEGGEQTTFTGTFHLVVEAVRGHPLVAFPPHPDPWHGQTELGLAQHDVTVDAHVSLVVTAFCSGGCADFRFGPGPNLTVPYDASAVEVTVTTDAGAPPVPFAMEAHGADTRAMQAVPAASSSPGSYRFRMEVGPSQGDSPYASQSLWEFRVHMDTPMGQGAWKGTYHVTATAYR